MVDLVRSRKAYLKAETTYGVEAGSTDGSDFTYIDAFTVGPLNDGKVVIDTPQASGRMWPTAAVPGPDGGTIEITTPLIGLNGSAISGSPPPANDWLDVMLLSVFGSQRLVSGTSAASPTSSSITFPGGHGRQLQDVVAVYQPTPTDLAGNDRSQPTLLLSASSANSFGYAPSFSGSPNAGTMAPGYKKYIMSNSGSQGTRTFSMVVCQDATFYTLKGCRPTGLDWEVPSGQNATAKWTIGYDSKTEETSVKTALPVVQRRPFTPIQGFTNGFWFNGTKYAFQKMSIKFAPIAQNIADQSTANARGSIDLFGMKPEIVVQPLFSTALQALKRNQTQGQLMLQIGSGVSGSIGGSGNLINMLVISALLAQVKKADPVADQEVTRADIMLEPCDQYIFSGSTSADLISVTRF
jgi:hypothetical protein